MALAGIAAIAGAFSSASAQDFRSPLIASPYSVSFSGTRLGKASAPQTVTLLNISASPVHITRIAVTGDFSETNSCPTPPTALAPNDGCEIQVTFRPSAADACSGTLTISHDATGGALTIGLAGTGNDGATQIKVSPSSISFPAQKVGTDSAPRDFTLSSETSKAISISDIKIEGDFTILPSSSCQTFAGTLAPNSSCKVVVTFSPLAPGKRDGAVTIHDDAEDSPHTVPLTGIGLPQ
jgi:hypothetical protein